MIDSPQIVQVTPTIYRISDALAAISDASLPRLLTTSELTSSQIGVVRLQPGTVDELWERHDAGDELLFIVAGAALLTVGTAQTEIRAGDLVVIERGHPHRFTVSEELELVYVTPRSQNSGWREGGGPIPHRHD